MNYRSLDWKVRPTIAGPLAVYIRDLLATGLYGTSASEVVRTLVAMGIQRAAEAKLITLRTFEKK